MGKNETIAALCTAPGGALAIIRISGPDALKVSRHVWTSGKPLNAEHPRELTFGYALRDDGSHGETCMAVYMPGPASYTGEDVVEIQCHGGEYAPRAILERIFRTGIVRSAEPGEFTKRAFLNGKLDLTQAEAVADLISAKSESAGRLAERQLSGVLGERIRAVSEKLYHLLAEIESRLDFPEENLDWKTCDVLLAEIDSVRKEISALLSGKESSAILRDGVRLVIAGSPNVGKSSLLNRLLGYDRAIVSDIPGTTRDTLRESASIRGIRVELTDTAGIRENAADIVEGMGIERSKTSLNLAEIIFWIFDASADSAEEIRKMHETVPEQAETIAVWNKADLLPETFSVPDAGVRSVTVSAHTGAGIDKLLELFEESVWKNSDRSEPECAVSIRHVRALEEADSALLRTREEITNEFYELAASNLHLAMAEIASITGESASPDILEDIFSRFCIGK